jgi:hypothetical protein
MMDVPRPWRLLDPAALSFRALPIAVMAAMVEMTEEEMVVLVVGLLVVEAGTVGHHHPEEGMGASAAAVIVHATTVVKEVTLPEIALMNPLNVMEGRVVVVRATATIVGSLVILQGIAAPQQQPVLRKKKKMEKQKRFPFTEETKMLLLLLPLRGHSSGVVGWGKRLCSLVLSFVRIRVNSD